MSFIPSAILNKLYNRTSLRNADGVVRFSVKNRLSPASLQQIKRVALDGQVIPEDRVSMTCDAGPAFPTSRINPDSPIDFPLGTLLTFDLAMDPLEEGTHDLEVVFDAPPFGQLILEVSDSLKTEANTPGTIPRDSEDDYSDAIIQARKEFIREQTGANLEHVTQCTFDPHLTQGNIEHFTGVAQIPLGFAGPLLVRGEHAQGEFYVPLATSEGTLVASYNRGMKVLHRSG